VPNPTITAVSKTYLQFNYNLGNPGGSQVGVINVGGQGTSAVVPDYTMDYGTGTVLDTAGSVNVNTLYAYQGSVAGSGGTKQPNLNGGSDLDFVTGAGLVMVKCKYFLVANLGQTSVTPLAPDGVQYFNVGPQGVSNAFSAAWGGSGATVSEQVPWCIEHRGPAGGWTVTASTAMLFCTANPGANALTIQIVIAGKQ
jgi:hypothetical protein